MDKRFENVVPKEPAAFDCAVERALHETEVEAMNRRKFNISLALAVALLLALAVTAMAVGEHFGILDFLSLNPRKDEGNAPEIEAVYVGMEMTIGGYEMELTEYYYEDNIITLFITGEPLEADVLQWDMFSVQVDGYEAVSYTYDGGVQGDGRDSAFLVTVPLPDAGNDTETVRIIDESDPANEYAIQVERSAGTADPLINVEITDASIEDAGVTLTGCDVRQTALETVLTVYYTVDPAGIKLTTHSDEPRYYREGDTWHLNSDCEHLDAPLDECNCSVAEIFAEGLNACECAEDWKAMMEETPDMEEMPGWLQLEIVDENGECTDFACGSGYTDSDDPLIYYVSLEIDNTMLNRLPDVVYIMATDFFENWKFEDTAAINVEVLKAE